MFFKPKYYETRVKIISFDEDKMKSEIKIIISKEKLKPNEMAGIFSAYYDVEHFILSIISMSKTFSYYRFQRIEKEAFIEYYIKILEESRILSKQDIKRIEKEAECSIDDLLIDKI